MADYHVFCDPHHIFKLPPFDRWWWKGPHPSHTYRVDRCIWPTFPVAKMDETSIPRSCIPWFHVPTRFRTWSSRRACVLPTHLNRHNKHNLNPSWSILVFQAFYLDWCAHLTSSRVLLLQRSLLQLATTKDLITTSCLYLLCQCYSSRLSFVFSLFI